MPVAASGDLFEAVDDFLAEGTSRRHLLLLAGPGTGKTSFVLNYYAYNATKPSKRRRTLHLVPLGRDDVEERIAAAEFPNETVLFLDALDEDVQAVEDHRARIRDLMELSKDFRAVVITCRTQFFSRDEEIPTETGITKIQPRGLGEGAVYEFWKLYLAPLNDREVRRYLRRCFKPWQVKARRRAKGLLRKSADLMLRPMLLSHLPELVEQDSISTRAQIYEAIVAGWIEREDGWVNKNTLWQFSERLAANLYLERERRGMEAVHADELSELASRWEIDIQPWQARGRALLNRDAVGNYKFSHRSIMEYLFAKQWGNEEFIAEVPRDSFIPLTDAMSAFILDSPHSQIETTGIAKGVTRNPAMISTPFLPNGIRLPNTKAFHTPIDVPHTTFKNERLGTAARSLVNDITAFGAKIGKDELLTDDEMSHFTLGLDFRVRKEQFKATFYFEQTPRRAKARLSQTFILKRLGIASDGLYFRVSQERSTYSAYWKHQGLLYFSPSREGVFIVINHVR